MMSTAISPSVFQNTEIAFHRKSDGDLKQTYWLFRIIASPFLTAIGPPITRFALACHLPVKGVIKKTLFKQFCGGETIQGCEPAMQQMAADHIGTILDYSLEGHEDEQVFDRAADEICRTIEYAVGKDYIPFSVFKMTGLGAFSLLEKKAAGEPLTPEEVLAWQKVKDRFDRICQLGYSCGQPVLVDAEHFWIQSLIDDLVLDAMRKYNKEKAVIFTTCQMYLKTGLTLLHKFIDAGRSEGFFVGVKMVRGAYMEIERERAKEKGYPSPIHDTKADSDACYDNGILAALDAADLVSLMAGTHNENSCLLLMKEMAARGMANDDRRICFAQLYGMSDNLSYNLAHNGYRVAKYLPYGSVEVVLPYLFRRAKENTSVAGQVGRELSLIVKEKNRRQL